MVFGDGPLGIGLTAARVIREVHGGSQAQRLGVSVGDLLLSVAGKDVSMTDYEEILSMIKASARPVILVFRRGQPAEDPHFKVYGGIWETEVVVACRVCGSPFGIFRPRHHCRFCGLTVCHACSPGSRIPPGDGRAVRECTACRASVLRSGASLASAAASAVSAAASPRSVTGSAVCDWAESAANTVMKLGDAVSPDSVELFRQVLDAHPDVLQSVGLEAIAAGVLATLDSLSAAFVVAAPALGALRMLVAHLNAATDAQNLAAEAAGLGEAVAPALLAAARVPDFVSAHEPAMRVLGAALLTAAEAAARTRCRGAVTAFFLGSYDAVVVRKAIERLRAAIPLLTAAAAVHGVGVGSALLAKVDALAARLGDTPPVFAAAAAALEREQARALTARAADALHELSADRLVVFERSLGAGGFSEVGGGGLCSAGAVGLCRVGAVVLHSRRSGPAA